MYTLRTTTTATTATDADDRDGGDWARPRRQSWHGEGVGAWGAIQHRPKEATAEVLIVGRSAGGHHIATEARVACAARRNTRSSAVTRAGHARARGDKIRRARIDSGYYPIVPCRATTPVAIQGRPKAKGRRAWQRRARARGVRGPDQGRQTA